MVVVTHVNHLWFDLVAIHGVFGYGIITYIYSMYDTMYDTNVTIPYMECLMPRTNVCNSAALRYEAFPNFRLCMG